MGKPSISAWLLLKYMLSIFCKVAFFSVLLFIFDWHCPGKDKKAAGFDCGRSRLLPPMCNEFRLKHHDGRAAGPHRADVAVLPSFTAERRRSDRFGIQRSKASSSQLLRNSSFLGLLVLLFLGMSDGERAANELRASARRMLPSLLARGSVR